MRTIGIIEEDATTETPENGGNGKDGKTKGAKTPKDGEGEK